MGKARCRAALQDQLKLPRRDDVPIVAMITRMTPQKGIDLVAEALDSIIALGVQFVMLASGDPVQERQFAEAEKRYPDAFRAMYQFWVQKKKAAGGT